MATAALRRRVATIASGAVVLLALASTVGLAAAGAAPVDESGYWWRFQPVAGSPITPPGVGDDQLYVAADAAGPSAISAFRFAVDADTPVELVLMEAAATGTPALVVCSVTGWTAPDGAGAWSDRPDTSACADAGRPGVRSDDGTWRFPVDSLASGGVLDVAVAPAAGSQSVTFDAPGPGAIVLAAPAPAPTATTTAGSGVPTTRPPAATATPTPPAPRFVVPDVADEAPSSGLAAPIVGAPASSFERDVDAFPRPTAPLGAARPGLDQAVGGRAPLAFLSVVLIGAAWVWRTRGALRDAASHPLAQPLRHRRDVLTEVGATVATQPSPSGATT